MNIFHCTQLSLEERITIQNYLEFDFSIKEISKKLKRACSTICREIKKGIIEIPRKLVTNKIIFNYSAIVRERKVVSNKTK